MAHLLELLSIFAALCIASAVLKSSSEWFRFHKAARQHGCKPPRRYPNKDPFFGSDLFFLIRKAGRRGHRSQAYTNLHRQYGGTYEMKALSRAQIQTAQPENIQAVAATSFEDFGVGPRRGNVGAPFLDRGVFTEDGEFWKHSRSLIRPTFNRNEIADLASFEKHVSRFLALLPADATPFDLQPLAKRLVSDTGTLIVIRDIDPCMLSSSLILLRSFSLVSQLNRFFRKPPSTLQSSWRHLITP